jgi:hypothetical protein
MSPGNMVEVIQKEKCVAARKLRHPAEQGLVVYDVTVKILELTPPAGG